MARLNNNLWNRHKFNLSGFVLLFSGYFFYQSLHPQFPAALPAQTVGEFTLAPMPFDLNPPYRHDGEFIKNFMVLFREGDLGNIRQAFMNIGPEALPIDQLQQGDLGLLHGSRYGQHVHALTQAEIYRQDRLWLSIENWQGEIVQASWAIPDSWVTNTQN
ncbi:hypothetical protein [Shewanella algae]|uniref:hypothetical protein n=1 Tax=Shewanella algae TaxID=38313 RepID=UPI000F42B7C1|nr:hypothetical protein [Shewanella algae]AYV14490.1 hypothetical protein EEY24_17405 [Shewanella algae]